MTVPAGASVFTGKASPGTAAAIARGILAEPFPLAQVNASRTLATQAVLGVLVPVSVGMTLSGVAVCVETAAAGTVPTGLFVAAFDLTGVRLAVSADLKSDTKWTTTGIKSFAFGTAYDVASDGAVYLAVLKNGTFASTEPKLASMTAVIGSGQALGANSPAAVTQASQATMPTTAVLAANDSFVWLAAV